jgi:hypothetical protein
VGRPDIADLDRYMWETDSPFERRPIVDEVEIVAKAGVPRARGAVEASAR